MKEIRCVNCMHILDEAGGKCPNCGFDQKFNQTEHYQLPIGSTLSGGRYYVGRVIGEGGFGITYIGWDEKFSAVVAIKEFYSRDIVSRYNTNSLNIEPYKSSEKDNYRKILEKVRREAITVNQFNGLPSIVSVRDFFEENNTVYIVMEYVEGVTLSNYLKDFPHGIAPRKCLEMFKPLISSLRKIHKTGIIHRDISLDNIIYQPDGTLKLLDFGSARKAGESETRSVTVRIGYAPAEQYIDNPKLHGPWSDVYSVCVCLYNCLTGTSLSDSNVRGSDGDIWANAGSNLPRELKNVLSMGLELDYKKRIQSSDKLYACLYEGETVPGGGDNPAAGDNGGKIKNEKNVKAADGEKTYGRLSWAAVTAAAAVAVILTAVAVWAIYLFSRSGSQGSGTSTNVAATVAVIALVLAAVGAMVVYLMARNEKPDGAKLPSVGLVAGIAAAVVIVAAVAALVIYLLTRDTSAVISLL